MIFHENSIIGVNLINIFSAVKDKSICNDIPVRDIQTLGANYNRNLFNNISLGNPVIR